MIKKILFTICFVILMTISTFAKDSKDRIYAVRNPITGVGIISTADGKILDKTVDTYTESLGLCVDAKTNEANYYFKVTGTHMEGMRGVEDTICTFYDKTGKEVGLQKENVWGSTLTLGKWIGVFVTDRETYRNKVILFDTEEKKEIEAPLPVVDYFGGRVVFSDVTYYDKDKEKKILVCDDDFDVIKTIDSYSSLNATTLDGKKVLRVGRINPDKDDDTLIINYLDEDFNFVYDPETELKKHEEEIGKTNFYDYEYDEKYNAATISAIKKLDDKLEYVYSIRSNGKMIFVANYPIEDYEKDDTLISNLYTADLSKSLHNVILGNTDDQNGYIFVDYDKVYDFDLNLVKSFDEKSYMQMHDKFGIKLYTDEYTDKMQNKDKFNVYDKNFDIVLKDISFFDVYSYDDYIVVIDSEGTKFYDKDFKVARKLDRKLMVYSWYSDKYTVFRDKDTNRMGILDKDYNVIIDGLKYIECLNDDYFTYQNGFRYGIMDYSGNVLLSFSIFDTMKEDADPNDYRVGYVDEKIIY